MSEGTFAEITDYSVCHKGRKGELYECYANKLTIKPQKKPYIREQSVKIGSGHRIML
jgi:hypothetical protein